MPGEVIVGDLIVDALVEVQDPCRCLGSIYRICGVCVGAFLRHIILLYGTNEHRGQRHTRIIN